MGYGIVSTGVALGEQHSLSAVVGEYTTDVAKVREWGFRALFRAPDQVGLTDLAATACSSALRAAGVKASDIDLIVLAMADIPEYLYWDAAAACQARVGSVRAEAVLVNQACSSGVAAFDTAAGKFATHPGYSYGLIVAANRVCETYRNRVDSDTAVVSDGAVAAVIARGHGQLAWLTTEIISDGAYADLFRLNDGGGRNPFRPNSTIAPLPDPLDRFRAVSGNDASSLLRFFRLIQRNTREVVERACDRVKISPEEVGHILHVNDNQKSLSKFAGTLGIEPGKTNLDTAMKYGHLGAADQLLALHERLSDGRITQDDIVALTAVGTGMHWSCTLLGPAE